MHFPKSGDNAKKRDSDTGALHISGRPLGSPGSLTWRQGLLQFLCLLLVRDDQRVKVSAAPNFELHIVLIFLDLDGYQRPESRIKWYHRRDITQFTCCLCSEVALLATTLRALLPSLDRPLCRNRKPEAL